MLDVNLIRQQGDFRLDVAFRSPDVGVTALFGRSGAGKTSVVNMVAGLVRPDRGHIVVNSRTLFDAAKGLHVPPEKRRVGYIFQDGRLFPHLSVKSNLTYGMHLTPAFRAPCRPIRRGGSPGYRPPSPPPARQTFGWGKAARRYRPGLVDEPGPASDGRTAGLPRPQPQGRSTAFFVTAVRRTVDAHPVRQPFPGRGAQPGGYHGAAGRRAGGGLRADRGLDESARPAALDRGR